MQTYSVHWTEITDTGKMREFTQDETFLPDPGYTFYGEGYVRFFDYANLVEPASVPASCYDDQEHTWDYETGTTCTRCGRSR